MPAPAGVFIHGDFAIITANRAARLAGGGIRARDSVPGPSNIRKIPYNEASTQSHKPFCRGRMSCRIWEKWGRPSGRS
ncbi:MAG: hypothetical protein CMH76_06780 [Nitrospinae bacterium]|nr:hypothetical protein [Nitrospinota bacterium]